MSAELTPERWARLDAMLDQALDLPPERRSAFLDRVCAGEPRLRSEVEALLKAEAASSEYFERVSASAASVFQDAAEPASRPPVGGAGSRAPAEGAGARIGPFRLIREIGRGGMGVVHLAEDTRLGRSVALKLLAPHRATDGESARLFELEARAVAALDHPNVATLFETDVVESGHRYLAFAYYPGVTLRERIDAGPLPWSEAIDIVRGIASGLAAAHARGIVHGDVKPSNVLLTEAGGIKLLDFGIATMARATERRTGPALGTAAYMSPERIEGDPPDAPSDLWSVGVILYEMLSGRRPFNGESTAALIDAIRHEEPLPLPAGEAVGARRLAAIAEQLLRREPGARYASADHLLADLAPGPSTARRRPPDGVGPRVGVKVMVGVALVAAAAGLLARFGSPSGARDGAGAAEAPAERSSSTGIRRLAVLPFEDRTSDSTSAAFTAGVQGEIMAALGSSSGLDVFPTPSASESAVPYRSGGETADRFAVHAYLEGALSIVGDTIELAASVLPADRNGRLWADTFRVGRAALPRVAEEVAAAVSRVLAPGRPADASTRSPDGRSSRVDPEAYQAYLRGVFHLDRSSRESLALAERYLRLAIERDSTFAAAYANLAEARGRTAFFGLRDPAATVPGVEELIERALALDSTLALAHARMAPVHLFWRRDPDAAERAARRAIVLNPSAAEPHRTLSEILAVHGKHREALASALRAAALDPWSQFAAFRPGVIEYYARDFEAAAARMEEGLRNFPEFWQGYWVLCMSRVGAERPGDAIAPCEEALRRSRSAPMATAGLGVALAGTGDREGGRRMAAELIRRSGTEYVAPMYVAMVFAALGERDPAFQWLERAYVERDLMLVQLGNYAFFDELRGDPRFRELLARMGLPDPHPEL